MSPSARSSPTRPRIPGALAGLFGLATVFAAANVLVGPTPLRDLAGDVVPFIVRFNLVAGFACLAAAIGLWTARPRGHHLAIAIAVATPVAGLGLVRVARGGAPVEPRTGAARAFRTATWALIARLSAPRRRP